MQIVWLCCLWRLMTSTHWYLAEAFSCKDICVLQYLSIATDSTACVLPVWCLLTEGEVWTHPLFIKRRAINIKKQRILHARRWSICLNGLPTLPQAKGDRSLDKYIAIIKTLMVNHDGHPKLPWLIDAPPSEVKELGCSLKRILVLSFSFFLFISQQHWQNVLRSSLLHAGAQRHSWLARWAEILAFFYQGGKPWNESMRHETNMWKNHFMLKQMWWMTGNGMVEHIQTSGQRKSGSKEARQKNRNEKWSSTDLFPIVVSLPPS